jgi:site-specific DNA-cytosine methylase
MHTPNKIMKALNHLDLFTGLGGFVLAAKRAGNIETIFTSEIDTFDIKLIEQNLDIENAGDINHVCVSAQNHPYSQIINERDVHGANIANSKSPCLVPVEETGLSSLTMEDFMEGVVEFPDIVTGGFPCTQLSSANVHGCHQGLEGKDSGLVYEQLRIIETLEPSYCVFENAKNLTGKGLNIILEKLSEIGYIVEWGTVTACAFGYPHYRHRTFLVCYLPDSDVAQANISIFKEMHKYTSKAGEFNLPLLHEDPEYIKDIATELNPKSIKLRSKRLNAIGNAIVPDIAEAIFNIINDCRSGRIKTDTLELAPKSFELSSESSEWVDVKTGKESSKMHSHGICRNGVIYSTKERDEVLNVSNTKYKGLYSTIIAKDGNNNYTCKSRLTRPGGLGGLVGSIMSIGQYKGGLCPTFAEEFMGYPLNYTLLNEFAA